MGPPAGFSKTGGPCRTIEIVAVMRTTTNSARHDSGSQSKAGEGGELLSYNSNAMARFTQIRRRSNVPIILGAIAVAVIGFAATMIFLNWQSRPAVRETEVVILRPEPRLSGPIEVIDGDTVRHQGSTYRLVGFDTPERGDKARCDYERDHAEAATRRLRGLISDKKARLERVSCGCQPGQEGTKLCNYGRWCGSLSIDGKDVGRILIAEGLAHPYVCSGTSCPKRRPWCDGR